MKTSIYILAAAILLATAGAAFAEFDDKAVPMGLRQYGTDGTNTARSWEKALQVNPPSPTVMIKPLVPFVCGTDLECRVDRLEDRLDTLESGVRIAK